MRLLPLEPIKCSCLPVRDFSLSSGPRSFFPPEATAFPMFLARNGNGVEGCGKFGNKGFEMSSTSGSECVFT